MIGEAESEEVKRAKLLEVEAVKAAEGGSLGDALELLNQAITVAPNYASPYNNRAQVRGGRGMGVGERERIPCTKPSVNYRATAMTFTSTWQIQTESLTL